MKTNLIGISGKIGSGKDATGIVLDMLSEGFSVKSIVSFVESGQFNGYNFQRKKYADKLKDIACLLTGYTREQAEDREFKEKELGEEWSQPKHYGCENYEPDDGGGNCSFCHCDKKPLTFRKLLQLLGTDCGRNIIHPQIWVNALFADYDLSTVIGSEGIIKEYYPNWIITDVRFPNEAQAIKDRGGIVIRVNRNSWKPKAGDTIKIKVFSNWSVVTYTHTDDEGNHFGVGADGYKYKSTLIKEHKEEHPSETALDDYEFDHVIENNGSIEELVEKVKQLNLV